MDVNGEVKLQKKKFFLGGGGGEGDAPGWQGQGGCDRRSEVFVKIQNKNWGGGGWGGVRAGGGGGGGEPIRGWGEGGGSKVWGRWVMWGMGV